MDDRKDQDMQQTINGYRVTQRRDEHIPYELHGPPGARRYDYVPTFILRGLTHLHLEFTPAATSAG